MNAFMNSSLDSADFVSFNDSVNNPHAEEDFIVQEIEYLLPQVIQSLRISVLDENVKRRLEVGLLGRKGFRTLPKSARQKAIDRLEDNSFATVLRNVQQLESIESQGNSTTTGCLIDLTELEETKILLLPTEVGDEVYAGSRDIAFMRSGGKHPFQGDISENSLLIEVKAGGIAAANTSLSEMEKEEAVIQVPKLPIELQEPIAGRNIRGLVALLRGGKLVAFLEKLAGKLVGDDVEKIDVPRKKVFARLDVNALMTAYHELSVVENLVEPSDVKMELRLMNALLVAMENEEQWSRINLRRFHLITKDCSLGLTEQETVELQQLENLAEQQMYLGAELPFAELAMLETYAASLRLDRSAA